MAILYFFIPSGPVLKDRPSGIEGDWKFYFTYSNDTSLIYRGNMNVNTADSLMVTFEIFAPHSTRAEKLKARQVQINDKNISGTLLYDRYKIRGGYLEEHFSLDLKTDDTFEGEGHCIQNCAEGTENATIYWFGSKTPD
ncbi:MAG: hypothetical protein KDC53_17005 [Saprospiraceae bacterium]|nr:hypothetical protein [Saprospiraceae bacterium]